MRSAVSGIGYMNALTGLFVHWTIRSLDYAYPWIMESHPGLFLPSRPFVYHGIQSKMEKPYDTNSVEYVWSGVRIVRLG